MARSHGTDPLPGAQDLRAMDVRRKEKALHGGQSVEPSFHSRKFRGRASDGVVGAQRGADFLLLRGARPLLRGEEERREEEEEARRREREKKENLEFTLTARSAAAVASTSLPALQDRSVGVKRGQNPNIGVEGAISKLWGEKRTKPKHWGFPDYYPKYEIPNTKPKPTPSVLKKWSNRGHRFHTVLSQKLFRTYQFGELREN